MKPRNLYFVLILIVLSFLPVGYGNSAESQNETKITPLALDKLPEFRISKGEILYSRYCVFCHGESGKGDGLNAFSIPEKPFNLGNRELMGQKSDEELEKVILLGGASQELSKYMPSFANTLSYLQVKHLVDFIRKQLPEMFTDD
jgi:mono/diheme cytochrome c family protein